MTAPKFRMISAQESGIGGFLLLFAIILVISILVILIQIPGFVVAIQSARELAPAYPPYPYLVIGELIFLLARCVGCIVGLVLIFRRDRRAPLFFVAFFGVIIVGTLIDMYFGSQLSDAIHALGRSTAEYDEAHRTARYRSIGSLLWDIAWLQYWRTSERVRLTFTPGPGMTEIATPT